MTTFSQTVDAFWRTPLVRGEVLLRAGPLTVASDPGLADDRRVTIIDVGGTDTIAALSPEMAARVLVRPIRDESELRNALATAHVSFHPADAVFYFSRAARRELMSEQDQANVRRLSLPFPITDARACPVASCAPSAGTHSTAGSNRNTAASSTTMRHALWQRQLD